MRVSKRFNARKFCSQRTYRYLFPLDILHRGPTTEDVLIEKLDRFKRVIERLKGRHPFHNFTTLEKHDTALRDQHFRQIFSVGCSDPFFLYSHSVSAVEVSITGDSFLFNQIRHLMGASIAVVRGNFPGLLINATLAPHMNLSVPLAPSESLILAGSDFKVPESTRNVHLSLEAKMRADLFRLRFIDPSVDRSLRSKDIWDSFCMRFDKACVDRFTHAYVDKILGEFDKWYQGKIRRNESRN